MVLIHNVYNPKTDKDIAVNYSVEDVIKAKAANKTALQKELGLEGNIQMHSCLELFHV